MIKPKHVINVQLTLPRCLYDEFVTGNGRKNMPTRELSEVLAMVTQKFAPTAEAFGVMNETKIAYFVWVGDAAEREQLVTELNKLLNELKDHGTEDEPMVEELTLRHSKKPVPEVEWRGLFVGVPCAIDDVPDRPQVKIFGNKNFKQPEDIAEVDRWYNEYLAWKKAEDEFDAVEPVSTDDLVNMFIPRSASDI